MPATIGTIVVEPQQGLTVDVTVTNEASNEVDAYTTKDGDTLYSWPHSASGRTVYHLPSAGIYVVSCKYNGAEIAGRESSTVSSHIGPSQSMSVLPILDAEELNVAPFSKPMERVAVSTDTTVDSANKIVGCTADGITVTLATAAMADGAWLIVKDEAGAAGGIEGITIATEGSETIDGAATIALDANWEGVTLYSDGSNWFTSSAIGTVL